MKQTLLLILSLNVSCFADCQGVTLLYKGGGLEKWNDVTNWIQINTPAGQTPIQRIPTEQDDVLFSSSQSKLSSVSIGFENFSDTIEVGGNATTGYRCKSMRVSNTDLSLHENDNVSTVVINVYTTNGGFMLIDSGSNFHFGHVVLHGGNTENNDMEVVNSTFGSLFSHNNWSDITLQPGSSARFTGSTLGGLTLLTCSPHASLYAENCIFMTSLFLLGDSSFTTILNSSIQNSGTNVYMVFHIGKDANFVSNNVNITSFNSLDFYTSGSILNGNVTVQYETSGGTNFTQEDPAKPLPNIINGNFVCDVGTLGIAGDLKISGNFENHASYLVIYTDRTQLFINGQYIFDVGGIHNYGNNLSITNCTQGDCHFNLEFFGNTNSNIFWSVGLPIDTLIVNKSGCAKVTATNSLYVSGQAKIKSGQLVLDPNDTIPYKLVCAGDLNIYNGGGVFLRRESNTVVANIAVNGAINDFNPIADSACTGLSNPYKGNITLFRIGQNGGNHLINIMSVGNIGNLNLIGQTGSNFILGGNLMVNTLNFTNPGKLLLGDHDLVVDSSIFNFGVNNYFVTDGAGSLQINNIGNTARIFPVGPSVTSYNPATLVNLGTPDNFKVNVQPGILSGGTSRDPYIAGVVNRTWHINETTSRAGNINLTLQWNVADELSGFTRNNCFLSHYTSGVWDNGIPMAASGSGTYSLTRTGITNFSPFAVMSPAGVLPVTLLDFTGKYKDKAIVLNWHTLTELNSRKFIIEKSNNAVTFKPLADIPAYGNSQVTRNYNYVDNAAVNNINYYRLKMIDINEAYVYSKTISVFARSGHLFTIFPNPVNDQLLIRLQDALPGSIIRIADAKGAIVRTIQLKAGATNTSVNTKDLKAGAYSVIFNSGKFKETLQFIRE